MKRCFISLLAIMLFLSCSKQDELPAPPSPGTSNVFSSNNVFNFPAYVSKATRSAERTFGQSAGVTITRIEEEYVGNCRVQTVYYRTGKGQESTYLVVETVSISANAKKITIDCYGTCDCREKVNVDAAGNPTSYECTCSNCKMDVIQES